MPGCCDPRRYEDVFGDGFARKVARQYRRKGLGRTERRMLRFLERQGIEGATVLEIGGGLGEMQVELLRRGAAHATNLELARTYETQARQLLEEHGLTGKVTRRLGVDIAQDGEQVEPADIVVLHRVVCCYPDYERLLAAARHANRLLVFSHPPRNPASRAFVAAANLLLRLSGRDFRAFTHPPRAMADTVARAGLAPAYRQQGLVWQVAGFTRAPAAL
jgi:2-polyprenyl-3-methyl-5-hydroxy-6-metoxy-1,4-benzoquinol methylase